MFRILFFSFKVECPVLADVVGSRNLAQIRVLGSHPTITIYIFHFCEKKFFFGRKTGQKMQVVIFFDFDTEL